MLIITRKSDESILLGENILIQVLDIRGSYVRIGIKAPKEVKVLRTELIEKDANKKAVLIEIETEKDRSE